MQRKQYLHRQCRYCFRSLICLFFFSERKIEKVQCFQLKFVQYNFNRFSVLIILSLNDGFSLLILKIVSVIREENTKE